MQMLRSFFDNELWQRRALDGFFEAWGGDTVAELRVYGAICRILAGLRSVVQHR